MSASSRPWPIARALRGLTPAGAGADLVAGLTLAAIAVPEQMATARLGGFAPELGFVAFAAAALGFALFGASRRLSVGADSTITPIFAGALAALAATGSAPYLSLAAALAVMVGALLIVAGFARLGWVADLLSAPVLTGFLAGVALHIAVSQAPAALGLPDGSGGVVHRLGQLAAQADRVNGAALAIAIGVFAVVFAAETLSPRLPGALIAVAGATGLAAALHLNVATLGALPMAWPTPHLPTFGLEHAIPLAGLSLTIALVVMVQTAATSRSFPDPGGEPDVARDFVGAGVASILAGLAGAFPVNASPPRTAITAESGGASQLAGLIAAGAVALVAAFGAALLAHVPTAALAGVLWFVAQRIFRVRSFAMILTRTRAEFALAAATALLIVALPIQTGVAIGVFLSLAHGVFAITRVRPIAFAPVPGTTVWWPARPQQRDAAPDDGVMVVGFQAPLSFLNAEEFRVGMLAAIERARSRARLLVLEASSIVEIDFTAAGALIAVIRAARAAGLDFAISRLESVRAQTAFERFGLIEELGADHLFRSVDEAVRALAGSPESGQSAGRR
jgi:MFS superfamily sulfate permease-like transporter